MSKSDARAYWHDNISKRLKQQTGGEHDHTSGGIHFGSSTSLLSDMSLIKLRNKQSSK